MKILKITINGNPVTKKTVKKYVLRIGVSVQVHLSFLAPFTGHMREIFVNNV